MIVLGLSGALNHDPSAALLVDGEIVAAAEEERFIRDKHAKDKQPLESAKFCLEYAGISPEQVDYVAYPFAPISIFSNARWHYAKRHWYTPDRSFDALLNGNRSRDLLDDKFSMRRIEREIKHHSHVSATTCFKMPVH